MTGPHPAPLAAQKLYELVTIAAAPQRNQLRVDFGDPGRFEEPDAIAIGLSVRTPEGFTIPVSRGLGTEEFAIDIDCTAQSWSGDDSDAPALARMVRVFEVVDLVRDVLRTDRDLGLPTQVHDAALIREVFSQIPDERGELAFVEFIVRVHASRDYGG